MRYIIILVWFVCFTAGHAFAHAQLISASPDVGAEVPAPVKQIKLQFTQEVEPKFSGIDVTADDGKPVPLAVAVDPNDASILIATPQSALTPNTYHLSWHVISVDTHRTQGNYSFTVKP